MGLLKRRNQIRTEWWIHDWNLVIWMIDSKCFPSLQAKSYSFDASKELRAYYEFVRQNKLDVSLCCVYVVFVCGCVVFCYPLISISSFSVSTLCSTRYSISTFSSSFSGSSFQYLNWSEVVISFLFVIIPPARIAFAFFDLTIIHPSYDHFISQ